jgi:Ulp1 family protease
MWQPFVDKIVLHFANLTNSVIFRLLHKRISRGEDKTCSNLHFFTSHFYTTLLNDGPESVTSWTAKKNINIFEKKFIFIPINKDLHWSLCVVVNPGSIKNSLESDLEKKANQNLPCLIFMDSLSLHKKATVRKKVETWLNSEYCRIHPDEALSKPFSKNSFELFTPGGTCFFLLPWLLLQFQR